MRRDFQRAEGRSRPGTVRAGRLRLRGPVLPCPVDRLRHRVRARRRRDPVRRAAGTRGRRAPRRRGGRRPRRARRRRSRSRHGVDPGRHPHPAVQAGARPRPAGRRRQALRAHRAEARPAVELAERARPRTLDLPEPTVGLRLPHGARPRRQRRPGRHHPVRITLRTPPGRSPGRRRRHPPGLRQPPRRPSHPAARPGAHRVRRDPSPRRHRAGLDNDVFVALTHARGAHSHLWGSWVQSAPGPPLPRHRHPRHLRRRRPRTPRTRSTA